AGLRAAPLSPVTVQLVGSRPVPSAAAHDDAGARTASTGSDQHRLPRVKFASGRHDGARPPHLLAARTARQRQRCGRMFRSWRAVAE
ncbi:MAG: hypothetical protein M3319_07965, partial [Actinomycetota bacterium]|nr:hypothetical protein [Actinomycetota bacterium]